MVEGPAQLDPLPRLLGDVRRREGGGRGVDVATAVGGTYDFGFRHDPDDPLGTLADYCSGCYTNLNPPGARRHDRQPYPGVLQPTASSSTR